MRLYVFDDAETDAWHPFSLTRPCGELLFGTMLLRERLERFAGRPATAHLTRAWLSSYTEPDAPPARSRASLPAAEECLLLSSRFVPSARARFEGRGKQPLLLTCSDEVAGCYLPAGIGGADPDWLQRPSSTDPPADCVELEVEGGLVDTAWRLIAENPGRLEADLAAYAAGHGGVDRLPDGVWKVGDHPIALGADVELEPGVVLDASRGPIRLADAVQVRAGSRLEGPLYVGRSTVLLGGSIGTSSLGPVCRLRGEIEASTVLGYANKAHDGFLGHSYLGRWVNLGAMTTNSDLKNNYGPIRLGGPDGPVETGLGKLGCLLGDHVKTAIGTRINAGTVVGAGSNLLGGALPPNWVPPFSWGTGADAPVYDRERFLAVAARTLPRRAVDFDERTSAWLASCWDAAARATEA